MAAVSRRSDGRRHDELRPLSIEYDLLARADGSGSFGYGDVKALASVSGPVEVRIAQEQADRATLDVSVRPISGAQGTDSKSLGAQIYTALLPSLLLHQSPRTLIQLVIQSQQTFNQPNLLRSTICASLINAGTLALINAGSFPMQGVVCAVTIGRVPDESTPTYLLDPDDTEISKLDAHGCFAFLFTSEDSCQAVLIDWMCKPSSSSENDLISVLTLAERGARTVWEQMKVSMVVPTQ